MHPAGSDGKKEEAMRVERIQQLIFIMV